MWLPVEQNRGVRVCLNPYTPHSMREDLSPRLVCAEPTCGFLLANAVINRWHVTTLLGRGPLADVYLAVDSEQSVADRSMMLVKVLRVALAEPLAEVERRLEHLLALRHPHIHPLYSVGWTSQPGMLYLISPYEEQGALSRYVSASAHLTPLAIAGIVRQIAEALYFAHERQIVHGRVKLENCLLVAPGTIQVSDFYSVLLSQEARNAYGAAIAPEQRFGQMEAASDQYALAVLAYLLLAGKPPFAESEPRTMIMAQEQALLRPLSEIRPDLSRQVDQTLGRAMSLLSTDRFPTIEMFAFALQAALQASAAGSHSAPTNVISEFPAPDLDATRLEPVPLTPFAPVPPSQPTLMCELPGHTSAASVLRWAADGYQLASAGGDEGIRVWQMQRTIGTPLSALHGHGGPVLALTWSPDNTLLASAGADATVRLWRPTAGAPEAAWWGHDGSVTALDWSPSGRHIASGGADRTIRLWDHQGTAVSIWQAHGRGGVTALAWSPDGRTLASGGADHLIQLWDTISDGALTTLSGHADDIRYLAWSPHGDLLASAAGKKDTRVCIWEVRGGSARLVATLSGHTREVVGLFWSHAGAWLVTAAGDSTLRYWDVQRRLGEPLGLPYHLQRAPVSLAGAPATGLIALGLTDLLIQVMQLAA
jgi:protein kinase-like protein/WD40 domain-containing protein